jgi:hypothetical protein
MAHWEGNTFIGERVVLDNQAYVKCTFTRCRIAFGATGPVSLIENTFNECTWEFTGPAAQMLTFLSNFYISGGGQEFVEALFNEIRSGRSLGSPPDPKTKPIIYPQ